MPDNDAPSYTKGGNYHHGDLKRALLEAAKDLIDEGGLENFTMARAARLAGVTSGAPYRHFKDRQALLAEMARQGGQMLEMEVDLAMKHAGLDPVEQLLALGETHLRFAGAHPAFYRVMHLSPTELGLEGEEDTELEVGANGEALTAAADGNREAAVRLGAQAAIYGLSRMWIDGQFPSGTEPDEAAAAMREILKRILHRA